MQDYNTTRKELTTLLMLRNNVGAIKHPLRPVYFSTLDDIIEKGNNTTRWEQKFLETHRKATESRILLEKKEKDPKAAIKQQDVLKVARDVIEALFAFLLLDLSAYSREVESLRKRLKLSLGSTHPIDLAYKKVSTQLGAMIHANNLLKAHSYSNLMIRVDLHEQAHQAMKELCALLV